MELKEGSKNTLVVCVYEMLGTATLMIGINWTSYNPGTQPFGIGMTLFAVTMIFGNSCGAHFNPAVTLGIFIKECKLSNFLFSLKIIFS